MILIQMYINFIVRSISSSSKYSLSYTYSVCYLVINLPSLSCVLLGTNYNTAVPHGYERQESF
jgi:hypothetical protein